MELKAINEVSKLLDEFGDSNSSVLKTQFSGIIKIETGLKILELIEKFRDKIENEPWELRYCSRIIPIQKTCQTDLITIKQNVADLIPLIDPNETYKISIERRDSKLIRNEIISNIAKLLTNHVSLERPAWEFIIQFFGYEKSLIRKLLQQFY